MRFFRLGVVWLLVSSVIQISRLRIRILVGLLPYYITVYTTTRSFPALRKGDHDPQGHRSVRAPRREMVVIRVQGGADR